MSADNQEPTPVELIETFLRHYGNQEEEKAVEQFTEDAVYEHPPNYEGGNNYRIEGREALLDHIQNERDPYDWDYELVDEVVDGNKGAVVGSVEGGVGDSGLTFVAFATTEDGKIARYTVGLFYTESHQAFMVNLQR